MRHHGRQAALHGRARDFAPLRRPHAGIAAPRAGNPARGVGAGLAYVVSGKDFHREQDLPAHGGGDFARGGLCRRRRGTEAFRASAAPRDHARRRREADRAAHDPHFALRLLQGRRACEERRAGDRAGETAFGDTDRFHDRLLPPDQGKVRPGPRAEDRAARVRFDRSDEGRRSERQAVRRPGRGLFRYRAGHAQGRVRMRLFGHRRRDRRDQGGQVRHYESERKGVLCEEHLLYRHFQAQR